MNKKDNNINNKASYPIKNNTIIENKVIEKSLDSKIDFDVVDNANAYYSERYGWTLRKN